MGEDLPRSSYHKQMPQLCHPSASFYCQLSILSKRDFSFCDYLTLHLLALQMRSIH